MSQKSVLWEPGTLKVKDILYFSFYLYISDVANSARLSQNHDFVILGFSSLQNTAMWLFYPKSLILLLLGKVSLENEPIIEKIFLAL